MVEKGAHKRALEELKDHPHISVLQKIAKGMEGTTKKFLGREVVVYEDSDAHGEKWVTGLGCSDEFDADAWRENDDEAWYEVWERVVDGVFNEYCDRVGDDFRISHSVDM
jgi:hypothetical protein